MKEVEYYSQCVVSVPDSIEILTLCTKTLKSIMLQLQVVSKNWKQTKENESTDFLSISELLSQRKLCNINIYACIGKMVLGSSLTSPLRQTCQSSTNFLSKSTMILSEIWLLPDASYVVHLYITSRHLNTMLPSAYIHKHIALLVM
jgi:hypothetical protein